jgi:HNH endonuclease
MKEHIKHKIDEAISKLNEPTEEILAVKEFLTEFDYVTKYLSRLLKVRSFVMYLLFFKKAYFEEGQSEITVKLADLGKNLLSDLGQPMSGDVVKRGISDLVHLNIIEKSISKPGQINVYKVKLPSQIKFVQECIAKDIDSKEEIFDDDKTDYYTNPLSRLKILQRDDYKCFYCLRELPKEDFYLDHIKPRTFGGRNYKSNLLASCKSCNTKKNASNSQEFLLQNYRVGLLTQVEFTKQNSTLQNLVDEYNKINE